MNVLLDTLRPFVPTGATVVLAVVGLFVARRILDRLAARPGRSQFRNQLWMLGLTAIAGVVVVMSLPIGDAFRGQLLGFFGILISAAIALSSTTFLGNAMAGILLRVVRNFRIGDFVTCGTLFGRVTERGLFHTEIQNENRELVTIPNLYLATNPVTTIRSSGTIVEATVSLGYDVPRTVVEEHLLEGAGVAGLREPFVHVVELGDFSVTYRVAGLLEEVKHLLTARSHLRECMLDALHGGGVEIVSPTFMNTRGLDPDRTVIPRAADREAASTTSAERTPESVVFDKADEAESLAQLKERWEKAQQVIESLEASKKDADNDEAAAAVERKLEAARSAAERLRAIIESRESDEDRPD